MRLDGKNTEVDFLQFTCHSEGGLYFYRTIHHGGVTDEQDDVAEISGVHPLGAKQSSQPKSPSVSLN